MPIESLYLRVHPESWDECVDNRQNLPLAKEWGGMFVKPAVVSYRCVARAVSPESCRYPSEAAERRETRSLEP